MKKDFEKRLAAIEARNAKVELDKAWETSWTRRLSIAILTYAVIVIYLTIIHNNAPFINAAVPVVGFLLSTLFLRRIKEFWQSRND
jgi:nicotinamide riboside transporter PnuC